MTRGLGPERSRILSFIQVVKHADPDINSHKKLLGFFIKVSTQLYSEISQKGKPPGFFLAIDCIFGPYCIMHSLLDQYRVPIFAGMELENLFWSVPSSSLRTLYLLF